MNSLATVKIYDEPEIDKSEIFRYAKIKSADTVLDTQYEECLKEALEVMEYKVVFREYDDRIVFAATIGMGLDMLLAKYRIKSFAKTVMLSAIGSERVEALCDAFCEDMRLSHPDKKLKTRVSPGYGSLKMDMQKDIFNELDVTKNIGIALTDGYFMKPVKSVTAIIYFDN